MWVPLDLSGRNLSFIKRWWKRIRGYRGVYVGKVRGIKTLGNRPNLIILDDFEEDNK